jgi:hypothetical protein
MGELLQTTSVELEARSSQADSKASVPRANFFLVGAPKAGTTSVDSLLRGHPEVFLSPIKEPCHFCSDVLEHLPHRARGRQIDMAAYLSSPQRDQIHLARVSSREDYSRLFEGAEGCKIVGECSTYYLSSADAPGEIHAYNPDAKILIMVRRPLDRMRSHYAMDRHLGFADRPLLSLVEEELALGDAANWGNCSFYVGASRYGRQIAAFRRFFRPEAICVLSFERMIAEPDSELRRLFAFLDITTPPAPLALPSENRSQAARFPWLHHGLRRSGLKTLVASVARPLLEKRAGGLLRSVYYGNKAQVVSEAELDSVARLLVDSGVQHEYDLIIDADRLASVG